MAGLARGEARLAEKRPVKAEQRRHAADRVLVEGAQHPPASMLAVGPMNDELRDQRVVERRDLIALRDARVDADTRAAGLAVQRDPAGRRQEPVSRILGVDPALDRVTDEADVLLRKPSGSPAAIRICSRTRSRPVTSSVTVCSTWMRVFISRKKYSPSRLEQTLDRPGASVADRAGCLDRDGADPLAKLGPDGGRRRFLDELLVTPLDRAVPLAEMDDVAVRVREHLHLDVPRVLEELLHVHGRVGEVGLALAARRRERALGVIRAAGRSVAPCRRRPPTP